MEESVKQDSNTKTEEVKEGKDKYFYLMMIVFAIVVLLSIGVLKLIHNGLFDRDAEKVYADVKDYQACKVVSEDVGLKSMRVTTINALVCELSPTQQKTPESVQLAQKKVVELSEEIKEYSPKTIKELNSLLDDDFVKKNPERAIDNILADMKKFDLCLVVSSETKMAVDCSLKEKEAAFTSYRGNEVDKVNEYHQTQSKINHQLGLIDKKYFTYFKNERDKEIKEVKNDSDVSRTYSEVYSQALRQKAELIQKYENLQIQKKIVETQKEIKKSK